MIKINGHSDDIVYYSIEDDKGKIIKYDEIAAYNKSVKFTIGSPEDGGLIVRAVYSPKWAASACWTLAVSPIVDGVIIPWDVEISTARQIYSPRISIAAPHTVSFKYKRLKVK